MFQVFQFLKLEHTGTPVCTTEMIAFARAYTYFQKLNTELRGLSIDSNASHLAWMYDIYCKTGIKLPFPIIADRNGQIARKYGNENQNGISWYLSFKEPPEICEKNTNTSDENNCK